MGFYDEAWTVIEIGRTLKGWFGWKEELNLSRRSRCWLAHLYGRLDLIGSELGTQTGTQLIRFVYAILGKHLESKH